MNLVELLFNVLYEQRAAGTDRLVRFVFGSDFSKTLELSVLSLRLS
jgi:hypothetical protein